MNTIFGTVDAGDGRDELRIKEGLAVSFEVSATMVNGFEMFFNEGSLSGTLDTGDGGQTFINRGTIAADTTINMGSWR